MEFLALIPGLSNLLQLLGNFGIKLYDTKLQAEGSHEAKVVELAKRELDLDQREAELNSAAKSQIRGNWYAPENLMFYFVALPYYFKAITMDNTLGSLIHLDWVTPHLEGDTAKAMSIIMAFWFGKRTVDSIGAVAVRVLGKK